jgi:hypothetical protein
LSTWKILTKKRRRRLMSRMMISTTIVDRRDNYCRMECTTSSRTTMPWHYGNSKVGSRGMELIRIRQILAEEKWRWSTPQQSTKKLYIICQFLHLSHLSVWLLLCLESSLSREFFDAHCSRIRRQCHVFAKTKTTEMKKIKKVR